MATPPRRITIPARGNPALGRDRPGRAGAEGERPRPHRSVLAPAVIGEIGGFEAGAGDDGSVYRGRPPLIDARSFGLGDAHGFFGFLGIRVSLFASSARPYQNKRPHVSDRTDGRLRDGLGGDGVEAAIGRPTATPTLGPIRTMPITMGTVLVRMSAPSAAFTRRGETPTSRLPVGRSIEPKRRRLQRTAERQCRTPPSRQKALYRSALPPPRPARKRKDNPRVARPLTCCC